MTRHALYKSIARRGIRYFSDSFQATFTKSEVTVDPITGDPLETVTEETVDAIFLSMSSELRSELEMTVQDRMIRVPAGDLTFTPDDTTIVVTDDASYRVVKEMNVKPGANLIYHQYVLRKT